MEYRELLTVALDFATAILLGALVGIEAARMQDNGAGGVKRVFSPQSFGFVGQGGRGREAAEVYPVADREGVPHAVRAHEETALEKASRVAKLYRMPILLVLTYVIMRAVVALVAGW